VSTIHILLPVDNQHSAIARFLDYLLKQTHRAYQMILNDDGTTDGTAAMVTARLPGT